jgi:hypothetical protein
LRSSIPDGSPAVRVFPSGNLRLIAAAHRERPPTRSGIVLAPDTIFIGVGDGSGRLLSLDGDFYTLSATGADMLRRLLDRSVEAVVREFTRGYDAAEDQIRNDIFGLLAELRRRDLVKTGAEAAGTRWTRRRAPSSLLFPLLGYVWRMQAVSAGGAWWLLALARVACRLRGWSSSVACWRQFMEKMQPGQKGVATVGRAAAIDAAVRLSAARHPMGMGCKERALACWFLMRRADIRADLVLGVNLYPLASHCWCEWRGNVYSDDAERCGRYEEILRYRVRGG